MGCCPSKRRAAQQAVVNHEIQEQERGRSDTNIGEEYINPLRSKKSNASLGSTVTNPTFHLAGPGGGGGDDGSNVDAPGGASSGLKGGVGASSFKKRASQRANASAKKHTAALLKSMAPVVEPRDSPPSNAAVVGAPKQNMRRKQSVYNGFQDADETDNGDGGGSNRNGNTTGPRGNGTRVRSNHAAAATTPQPSIPTILANTYGSSDSDVLSAIIEGAQRQAAPFADAADATERDRIVTGKIANEEADADAVLYEANRSHQSGQKLEPRKHVAAGKAATKRAPVGKPATRESAPKTAAKRADMKGGSKGAGATHLGAGLGLDASYDDKGASKVQSAITKIKEEAVQLQAAVHTFEKTGAIPDDLVHVAAEQLLRAIGVTRMGVLNVEQQLSEDHAEYECKSLNDALHNPLVQDRQKCLNTLKDQCELAKKWGLGAVVERGALSQIVEEGIRPSCYHGTISADAAGARLVAAGSKPGTYLLRMSGSSLGVYSVSFVNVHSKVQNTRIKQTVGDQYSAPLLGVSKSFSTVLDLVDAIQEADSNELTTPLLVLGFAQGISIASDAGVDMRAVVGVLALREAQSDLATQCVFKAVSIVGKEHSGMMMCYPEGEGPTSSDLDPLEGLYVTEGFDFATFYADIATLHANAASKTDVAGITASQQIAALFDGYMEAKVATMHARVSAGNFEGHVRLRRPAAGNCKGNAPRSLCATGRARAG